VLHLRSSAGILGAENVIIELAKYSPAYGYHPIVGALKDTRDPFPEFIHMAREHNLETVVFESRGRLDFRCIRRLRQYGCSQEIDIVHCHGYKEDVYGMFLPSHIAKVATNHLWKRLFLRGKINAMIDTVSLQFFDEVVGVSDGIMEDMRKHFVRNTNKISNGIDTEKYVPKEKSTEMMEKLGINPDVVVLGMISSLTFEKGHLYAFQALQHLQKPFPDLHLLVVGDGKMKDELVETCREMNLENRIVFAGGQKNIPEVLSVVDIFLLPSLTEGLPMAMLEAMATGKAVVATRVGENHKVIENGVTGRLIKPENARELWSAIQELLENENERKKMGRRAREVIQKRYSSKTMARSYCSLYDTVL